MSNKKHKDWDWKIKREENKRALSLEKREKKEEKKRSRVIIHHYPPHQEKKGHSDTSKDTTNEWHDTCRLKKITNKHMWKGKKIPKCMSYFLSFLKAWMYLWSTALFFYIYQEQISIFNIVKFFEKMKKTLVNSFKFCWLQQ